MSSKETAISLLRLPLVEVRTGISKSEIYRRLKLGTFPKPIKLGARAIAWKSSAIELWIESLADDTKQK